MEALRGAVHEQKENVEANISRGKAVYNNELPAKARTPSGKRHAYSTPKSMKVTDRSSSSTTKKPRRALGDISNQHRTPGGDTKSNGEGLGKRPAEAKLKASVKLGTSVSKKKATVSALTVATPKRAAPAPERAEEIEFAYGGLASSYSPDPAYLERIRKEIERELHEDKTPSILDRYETEETDSSQWEPEIDMLRTGAAPSPWWPGSGEKDASFAETITWSDDSIPSTIDLNTPGPDVCDDLQPKDNDDILDEILKIDIPVSID